MGAPMNVAKGNEKVGRLDTSEERKRKKERTEFGDILPHVLSCVPIPVLSPEDPVGRGRDETSSNRAEVLLTALGPCGIPPASISALSFAHCALAMLVFALCRACHSGLGTDSSLCLGCSSTR